MVVVPSRYVNEFADEEESPPSYGKHEGIQGLGGSEGLAAGSPTSPEAVVSRTILSREREISVKFDRSCCRQTAEIHALASVATTVIDRTMLSYLLLLIGKWNITSTNSVFA